MILTFSPSSALLAQLLPADPTLPPTVQFSATVTAKAMNEALKLTRHLPASASSPLSRLLASKGSLEWQKSIRTAQDIVPDTTRVGWRVLEKEDRLSTIEESKPKKATSGFLSFWSRRASGIQVAPSETPVERSSSPAGSSVEVKPVPQPSSSRPASPPEASTPPVPPPPPTDSYPTVVATAPTPSAVSRFLNRFSRMKGAQHGALALSSDDLEFLSDIVPSASDLLDEDAIDGALDAPTGASNSSPLPPKLPPPIPPPPKQPVLSSRSSLSPVLGTADGGGVTGSAPKALQAGGANHTPNVPVLTPPLSPKPAVSFSRTQSPSPLKDTVTPTITLGQSGAPLIQRRPQSSFQSNSQSQPFLTLSPPQKVSPLSIPPLLPPPPVSPPQTPRPSTFSTPPSHSSTTQRSDTLSSHDPHESDEEFTAFASFPPPPPAPLSYSDSLPLQRCPSPPSPPPRRTYEHTHYPSSSSTSSILSPTSQSSADQLYSAKPPIPLSLDSFDDFVSSPSIVREENRKHTPPPPPLPAKPRWQHQQPPRINTYPSYVHHVQTPSQTFTSPTVHTSLMTSMFSAPSVSDAEHERVQALVNHAAARGGLLWPNSPVDEPGVKAIPPPPSSSTSPRSLVGEESVDLLGDNDTFGDGLEVLPSPPSMDGGIGMGSVGALRVPSRVTSSPGKGLGLRNQLQPTPPTLVSTTPPILSSSSFGIPSAVTNAALLQPVKPKQTGGLSAQDLSFFEGL